MKRFVLWSTALAVVLCLAGEWARAADQTIRGKSLLVRNPDTPERRKISGVAKEEGSANVIVGNPALAGSAGGAILTVAANGVSPTAQTFGLPQGTSVTGKQFWRTSGSSGFRYKDAKGEQGPVRTVLVKKSGSGTFSIKVSIRGKNGPVTVVPPNPGTDGYLTLELGGGGDRYCVHFGSDGTVINRNATLFKVRNPRLEGCPGGASTTTSSTSSTTTTTLVSSPSPAFLDGPPGST